MQNDTQQNNNDIEQNLNTQYKNDIPDIFCLMPFYWMKGTIQKQFCQTRACLNKCCCNLYVSVNKLVRLSKSNIINLSKKRKEVNNRWYELRSDKHASLVYIRKLRL